MTGMDLLHAEGTCTGCAGEGKGGGGGGQCTLEPSMSSHGAVGSKPSVAGPIFDNVSCFDYVVHRGEASSQRR